MESKKSYFPFIQLQTIWKQEREYKLSTPFELDNGRFQLCLSYFSTVDKDIFRYLLMITKSRACVRLNISSVSNYLLSSISNSKDADNADC